MPIIFQLQQRGDHLRLEIGSIVMCVKTFREALGAFFTVEELRHTLHHFQPHVSRVGGSFRQCFRERHGEFVHGERGAVCQFQVQQPVVLNRRGRLRQIYEEFLIRLLVEHAVAHRKRNVPPVVLIPNFRGNQFDLAQRFISDMLPHQCCHDIRVLFLVITPKYDAPTLAWLAETSGKQPGYLTILTHTVPSFSSLQRIE